jgi:NADPH:quinone reductase-like Zn-dependent oxidoreductase
MHGRRVAFFPVNGTWGDYVSVRAAFVIPVPNNVADGVAAQMLINSITAQ